MFLASKLSELGVPSLSIALSKTSHVQHYFASLLLSWLLLAFLYARRPGVFDSVESDVFCSAECVAESAKTGKFRVLLMAFAVAAAI